MMKRDWNIFISSVFFVLGFSVVFSLIGIYMVTSGCPIMDKLRPMARFHLPFASTEETIYRAISTYLLGQYFLEQKGKKLYLYFLKHKK